MRTQQEVLDKIHELESKIEQTKNSHRGTGVDYRPAIVSYIAQIEILQWMLKQ